MYSANISRRRFVAGGLTLASSAAWSQSFRFQPQQRYPDPSVQVLDPEFSRYRIYDSSVEQIATGFRWTEGPVWFGDGRYLLFSDIPNNRIMRWDETTGKTSVFRYPANYANGLARDRQGRLLVCEHLGRRVTRTEYDGSITVLAERFEGKRLNSPNDIVCTRDGSIWFTDPPFGIGNSYQGDPATPELPQSVYRIDPASGALHAVITDLLGPNGLCFSPDEKTLYVVEGRHQPWRVVWAYDVVQDGRRLTNKRLHIDAAGPGALDGIKCDASGSLWCGWGSNGAADARAEDLDGVMVFNSAGKAIAHIRLPERCANICFGGAKHNRLFMTSSHSVYALYVEAYGVV